MCHVIFFVRQKSKHCCNSISWVSLFVCVSMILDFFTHPVASLFGQMIKKQEIARISTWALLRTVCNKSQNKKSLLSFMLISVGKIQHHRWKGAEKQQAIQWQAFAQNNAKQYTSDQNQLK